MARGDTYFKSCELALLAALGARLLTSCALTVLSSGFAESSLKKLSPLERVPYDVDLTSEEDDDDVEPWDEEEVAESVAAASEPAETVPSQAQVDDSLIIVPLKRTHKNNGVTPQDPESKKRKKEPLPSLPPMHVVNLDRAK